MVARTGESGGIYQASIQSTSRAVDEARARRWTGTDEAEAEREVRMEDWGSPASGGEKEEGDDDDDDDDDD